jgi:hypothetical protein
MELFSVYKLRETRRAESIYCVWHSTGNARQPLACVWIDSAAKGATGSAREAVASGEDHLDRLVA